MRIFDIFFFSWRHYGLVPPYRSFYPVKVLYQYDPVHRDELALKPNDIIYVIRLVNRQNK